jgi:hypothetical protein
MKLEWHCTMSMSLFVHTYIPNSATDFNPFREICHQEKTKQAPWRWGFNCLGLRVLVDVIGPMPQCSMFSLERRHYFAFSGGDYGIELGEYCTPSKVQGISCTFLYECSQTPRWGGTKIIYLPNVDNRLMWVIQALQSKHNSSNQFPVVCRSLALKLCLQNHENGVQKAM